jgi:hypothetical protein
VLLKKVTLPEFLNVNLAFGLNVTLSWYKILTICSSAASISSLINHSQYLLLPMHNFNINLMGTFLCYLNSNVLHKPVLIYPNHLHKSFLHAIAI